MKLPLLLRFALLAYPREFRRRFGEEILSDSEAGPNRFTLHLLEILRGGLTMRFEDFGRDLHYAVARLRLAPLFVAIVVLTFALGVGANVAVFSALNAVVLRPLPFAHAGELVTISKGSSALGGGGTVTPLDVSDLAAQLHGVSSIAGITEATATMLTDGGAKTIKGASVTPGFFRTIGAVPEIGRLLQDDDASPGVHNVVISDRTWRTSFDGGLDVLGKRATLDGTPYVIVGVMLPDAEIPEPWIDGATVLTPDYVTALQRSAADKRGIGGVIGALALLAPGTSIAQLNAELRIASGRVQALYPKTRVNQTKILFTARPLADQIFGSVARSLWMVFIAVLGILLVACANVANLISARWSTRDREVAVRRALGASTGRIATQLFIEMGLLALCGGVTGVVLAYVGLRVIPLTALDAAPRANTISIDGTVLLYALLMVCGTTILAGLAPVFSLGRVQLQAVLNSAGRGSDPSRGNRLRSALVVVEIAIAIALVISSGLVVRGLLTITNAPLGIRSDGVFESASIALVGPMERWNNAVDRARITGQESRLLSRLQALPGVDAASISLIYPGAGVFGITGYEVAGEACSPSRPIWSTENDVSPAYFRTLGIPLLRGREFTNGDSPAGAPVAIVSQGFVDAYMHGQTAIGRRVRWCGFHDPWMSIVGVVANVSQQLGMPPIPELYLTTTQNPSPFFEAVVHAPHSSVPAVQKEVQAAFAAVIPGKTPPRVGTISDTISMVTRVRRSATALLAALAIVTMLLALSGVYGVAAFTVRQRSHEFGVRIALGAKGREILADVLRRSLLTTAAGIAVGTVIAAVNARTIAPYLTLKSDVPPAGAAPQLMASPLDPVTFGIVIGLIFVCAAVAALIPALRAIRVDPVDALRYE